VRQGVDAAGKTARASRHERRVNPQGRQGVEDSEQPYAEEIDTTICGASPEKRASRARQSGIFNRSTTRRLLGRPGPPGDPRPPEAAREAKEKTASGAPVRYREINNGAPNSRERFRIVKMFLTSRRRAAHRSCGRCDLPDTTGKFSDRRTCASGRLGRVPECVLEALSHHTEHRLGRSGG